MQQECEWCDESWADFYVSDSSNPKNWVYLCFDCKVIYDEQKLEYRIPPDIDLHDYDTTRGYR